MKNFWANAFHILGILFFIFIIWIICELTGISAGFRQVWGVMQQAGH
jgi:hypothetical protein